MVVKKKKAGRRRVGRPLSVTFTDEQCDWLKSQIAPGETLTLVVRRCVQAAMERSK